MALLGRRPAVRCRVGTTVSSRDGDDERVDRLKDLVLRLLTSTWSARCLAPLTVGRATVLMFHRFRDPEGGIDGHDPELLRRVLAQLRRERYELLSVTDLFHRLAGEGPPLRRAVAFTVDDGYVDQALVGLPLFAEFDCPVTAFVTTGFLDGRLWMWWDQVQYTLRHTTRRQLRVALGNEELQYRWLDDAGRARVEWQLTEACKRVPDTEKQEAITRLAAEADIEIPVQAPADYAAMSWDQLRACEELGTTFGPHSVTHPILAQVSDERSSCELAESWNRLQQEAKHPIPVFCYPNGGLQDFGAREIGTLRRLQMLGAFASGPGYASALHFQQASDARFAVPRFGYPNSLERVLCYIAGVERLKQLVRRNA